MRNLKTTVLLLLGFALIYSGCDFRKLPLPVEKSGIMAFGANDTSYIEIKPVWNSSFLGRTLNRPTDIIVGPDGYLWVANSGNNEIFSLTKAGEILSSNNFDNLRPLLHPTALSLDSKLNLLMVNGSDTIFVWNEYANLIGIDSVASRVVFRRISGDTVHYSIEQAAQFLAAPVDSLHLHFLRFLFRKNENDIRSLSSIHPFYISPDPSRRYVGIAAGKFGSEEVYVSETFRNRIARFKLIPERRLKLKNGVEVFSYKGMFDRNVVTYGSGAGTVDTPRGIFVDRSGNLYLTQLGGNFLVQKLLAGTFMSQYELHKDPIMDLNRFDQPVDITLDGDNNIFVVDRGLKKVFKFGNSGPSAGKEISLGNKGLGTAEFVDPRGILVTDKVVYITDAGTNEIRRFKLSISENDLPMSDQNQP
ncbi:MAG: hypothetical protein GXO76_14685 [Calditrichaeota bacterium]|nr:hypothetical protein [Calditrichota bacterium]